MWKAPFIADQSPARESSASTAKEADVHDVDTALAGVAKSKLIRLVLKELTDNALDERAAS